MGIFPTRMKASQSPAGCNRWLSPQPPIGISLWSYSLHASPYKEAPCSQIGTSMVMRGRYWVPKTWGSRISKSSSFHWRSQAFAKCSGSFCWRGRELTGNGMIMHQICQVDENIMQKFFKQEVTRQNEPVGAFKGIASFSDRPAKPYVAERCRQVPSLRTGRFLLTSS